MRKTVDSLMAAYNKTVAGLKEVEEHHVTLADIHNETIALTHALRAKALEEATRAARIRAKLEEALK